MRRKAAVLAGTAGVVVVLGLAAALALLRPEPPQAGPTVVVDMEAARYFYAPADIEVAAGTTLVVRITSSDVTHGFFAPAFMDKAVTVPAGETVTVSFVADRPGVFEYFCTVFCGSGHPQHRGRLTVTA